MKSGSMSSYRAALSGTGADIGGERDDEQPSPVNEFSPIHPHEPAIPPALDIEGRCLVCVILCERDDARKEIRDLAFRVNVLESAIREHRSQKADDRCIEDDDRLYAALGDGIKCDRRVGCKQDMLKNCARFIERRCEGGQWPSYASLVDGIRHGAKMATDLWERLGEEGPLANEASMISAHLMGTIISEDGLDTP